MSTITNGVRIGGIYSYRDAEYVVINLSTPDQPWRAVGLMGHPFHGLAAEILYIRENGDIVDVNFEVIGTASDLMDTGRDDDDSK